MEFSNIAKFFAFSPSPSFVEIPITIGFPFLTWAFAAMSTGVSVIALANFDKVLPVANYYRSKLPAFGLLGQSL